MRTGKCQSIRFVQDSSILFNFDLILAKFLKLDYGREKNLKLYSTINPPEYNLSNVRTTIHLMHGTNDLVVMDKVRK